MRKIKNFLNYIRWKNKPRIPERLKEGNEPERLSDQVGWYLARSKIYNNLSLWWLTWTAILLTTSIIIQIIGLIVNF